jgi:nitroreductase
MGNPQAGLEAAANGGVAGAHELLVAVAPRDYDRVAVIDVGRSLQKVVTAATRAGISTCWIGPGAD